MEVNHDFGQKFFFATIRNERLQRLAPALNQF